MTIQYVVVYLSILFWIFPAIRQYKTELFWYFLVLALADPIGFTLIILKTLNQHNDLILNYILLVSVMWPLLKKSSTKAILLIVSLLFISSYFVTDIFSTYLKLSFHLMIIFYFTQRSLFFIKTMDRVNIFHLFLLLEETSVVLKIIAVLDDSKTGLAFFYITNLFEILIAIFFTIYREDNPKLFINLKKM